MSPLQNPLIFQHIPKNGGSTFHQVLNRLYEDKVFFRVEENDNFVSNLDEFRTMPQEERDEIDILIGHFNFGLHRHFSKACDYVTFLRDPVERIISTYNYVMGAASHRLHHHPKFSHEMTLLEFVLAIDDIDINNAQIRMIGGKEESEENMLAEALDNIDKHYAFVGCLERFDECLVILKQRYNWAVPYYAVANKSAKQAIRAAHADEVIETIRERNAGDMQLYALINESITSRLSEVSHLRSELLRLRLTNLNYKGRRMTRAIKKSFGLN